MLIMFVLTLENHAEGVYSLFDADKNRFIPIFQLEDDANRYLTMLEDTSEYPSMRVVEMEDHVIIEHVSKEDKNFPSSHLTIL